MSLNPEERPDTMPPLILDTHAAVNELVSAGMPERQAATVVRQQAQLLEQNLATKSDIEVLRKATKTDIEALRKATTSDIEALRKATTSDIEALRKATTSDIEALRQETIARIETAKMDLIKWLFGVNLGTASLVVALIKLL